MRLREGDLLIGDRGLAQRKGIRYVAGAGGGGIVRLNLTNVPLVEAAGQRFALLPRLHDLPVGVVGDWPASMTDNLGQAAGRVCAIKKSRQETLRAQPRARRKGSKEGRAVQAAALEAAAYIFVFTTISAEQAAPEAVLEMYRGCWQVELAVKRLKSILAMGHLKKTDPEGAKAWLQGKRLAAFLIEALIAAGERFSPWGYPLVDQSPALPVAGDVPHAPSAQQRG